MKLIFNHRLEQERREKRRHDPCSTGRNAGEIFKFAKDGSAVGQATDGLFAGDRGETTRTRALLAHAACGVGDDLVFVFELHAERRIRQKFGDDTREFEDFFFRHISVFFLWVEEAAQRAPLKFGRKLHNQRRFVNLVDQAFLYLFS